MGFFSSGNYSRSWCDCGATTKSDYVVLVREGVTYTSFYAISAGSGSLNLFKESCIHWKTKLSEAYQIGRYREIQVLGGGCAFHKD